MRIHSDVLTGELIQKAKVSGTEFTAFGVHGSRKRKRGFEIQLSGSSPRRNQAGTAKSAMWDEWGLFIDRLYKIDPDAVIGPYNNQEEFESHTNWRFEDGEVQRCDHKWGGGMVRAQRCSKCDAIRRW